MRKISYFCAELAIKYKIFLENIDSREGVEEHQKHALQCSCFGKKLRQFQALKILFQKLKISYKNMLTSIFLYCIIVWQAILCRFPDWELKNCDKMTHPVLCVMKGGYYANY